MAVDEDLRVIQVTAAERARLARAHPEVTEHDHVFLVASRDAVVRDSVRLAAALDKADQNRKLIDVLLDRFDPPSPHAVLQMQANAQARADLLREFGAVSSREIAELAGSRAKNRAALANRWESEGRVFSVIHGGEKRFPAFQLAADGRPLRVMEDIIDVLQGTLEGWQLAIWFTSANGWLGGRRPVDLMQEDPEAVMGAAKHGAAELVF